MDVTQGAQQEAASLKAPTPYLNAALAAFQAELPRVLASQTSHVRSERENYDHDYADLADLSEAALPLLGKHGLAFSGWVDTRGNQHWFEYSLLHKSGEERTREILLGPISMAPQHFGALVTYMRRYTLGAVCGIAGDRDDDGQAAQLAHERGAGQRQLRKAKDDAGDGDGQAAEPDKIAQALAELALKISSDSSQTVADLGTKVQNQAQRTKKLSALVNSPFGDQQSGLVALSAVIQRARDTMEARLPDDAP